MLIGIDWGGTKMEAVGLSADGDLLARHRVATPKEGYEACIAAVAELVGRVEADAGRTGSVGIGIPGSPSPQTGLVRNANTTFLNGRPLGRDLERALGRPVRLTNDANCLAVSEAVDGAGQGAHVVFGIIIGTGHGGGLVIDRKVHGGFQGVAAEIGHYPLPWMTAEEHPGPTCWCGRKGCLEMFVSGTGFELDFKTATGEAVKSREIIDRKRQSDADAACAYERYVDRLARSLALLVNVVDPDVFVLGGGLSNIDELYSDLPMAVASHVFGDSFETPIRKAVHGDSSGVRGAAWLWKE